METSCTTAPTRRADAQRNHEALLDAARVVFAEHGVEAPLDEVARAAGVGRATLYRHFPTREHLVVALVDGQLAELELRAIALLEADDPFEALQRWVLLYDRAAHQFTGMSRQLAHDVAAADSPVSRACAPMYAAFGRLFGRAQRMGLVREDISSSDVAEMVAALAAGPGTQQARHRQLRILLAGVEPRPPGPTSKQGRPGVDRRR